MKVVINTCYGCFGLSDAAFEKLIERGWTVQQFTNITRDDAPQIVEYPIELSPIGQRYGLWTVIHKNYRAHPDLVAIVEELGAIANGHSAKLQIVEIADESKWSIQDYNGKEWITESAQP